MDETDIDNIIVEKLAEIAGMDETDIDNIIVEKLAEIAEKLPKHYRITARRHFMGTKTGFTISHKILSDNLSSPCDIFPNWRIEVCTQL